MLNDDYIECPVVVSNSEELRVTICWTDPAGVSPSWAVDPTNLMLVNDLDLRVVDPSGNTNVPWILDPANPLTVATTGDNYRDNVEQVVLQNPSNGVYSIRVTHKESLSNDMQNVSILITGNQPQSQSELTIQHFEKIAVYTNLLEWPTVVGQLARVEVSSSLLDSWTPVSGDICATRTNILFEASTNPVPDVLFYRIKNLN